MVIKLTKTGLAVCALLSSSTSFSSAFAQEVNWNNSSDPKSLQLIKKTKDSLAPTSTDVGKGSLTDNLITVNATTNEILGSVFGAYHETDKAFQNRVNIVNGKISQSVYGGYSAHGEASNNSVSITGGSINQYITGGGSYWGKANGNKVSISGGDIKLAVHGGYNFEGEASQNSVTITGGNMADFVIGGVTHEDSATSNSVTITGGTIKGNVEGGHSDDGEVNGNRVTIKGGSILSDVYGGYSTEGDAVENSIDISGGVINGDIKGGISNTSAKALNNSVVFSFGEAKGKLMGGYSDLGTTQGNNVMIKGGEISSYVAGGDSLLDSISNLVDISGGTIKGDVIGGASYEGRAVNNIVQISGSPVLINSTIYGGYSDDASSTKDLFSGNVLSIYSKGVSAKNIANFEYINFYIPKDIAVNETLLTLTDSKIIDISNSKVGVAAVDGNKAELKKDDRINLIHTPNSTIIHPKDMTNNLTLMKGVSKIYDFKLKNDEENYLYALVTNVQDTPSSPLYRINPATKSFLEAGLSGTALINQGGELISSGTKAMQNTKNGDMSAFVLMNTSSIRHQTGSYVDVKGYNLAVGLAKETGGTTYGIYIEHGDGNYDSFNSFGDNSVVRGSGKSKYYGVGLASITDLSKNFYVDGSLRVGTSKTSYSSNDFNGVASFDINRAYFGAHLGVGAIFDIGANSNLNPYAKLLFTRQSGRDVTIRGDKISFDEINSLKSKLGIKYNYKFNDEFGAYFGGAYEREFDGKAKGYNHAINENLSAPKLKGDSGMFELGARYDRDKFGINANLQGYVGDKKGLSGGVKLEYKFN